jgi:hypothetical protein
MFCYLWWEKSNPNECKFGERWVKEGQDPVKEIWKRIKDSVGVRKDLINDGSIELYAHWDTTTIAQTVGRCKMHGRVDDYIREHTGFRKGKTGEVHMLSPAEMALKVNEFLVSTTQELPVASLSQWQYDAADNVLSAIAAGNRTILAELCARFGKTIWGGALAIETGAVVTVVASYVLTSFASFANDLKRFEQFRNLVVVDSSSDTYQDSITAAIKAGKQVVVFLSMCGSAKRQDRIDFLFALSARKLVIIDEADYGAHTAKQCDPFIAARNENDVVILMTGTNGERACGAWGIDHYLGTTYAELLLERAGK